MNSFEERRNQKISEILATIKVIYILLGMVAMMSSNKNIMDIANSSVSIYIIVILVLVVIYFAWIARSQQMDIKSINIKYIFEISLLLSIFIIVLMTSDLHKSPYKFICIFIIMIAAIQYGKKHSLIVAVLSAGIIIGIDLLGSFTQVMSDPALNISGVREIITYTKNMMTASFEADLVIISALLVTSYILGMYVDIEEEHSSELKNLVSIDELTGLFNHRYFQEQLSRAIESADEINCDVSLLFMDIDYFKHYNDTNGHQAGDLVLRKVGEILKNSVRDGDIVARYGGEEFAVILPCTNIHDAITVGERVRKAIQHTHFYGQENQPNRNITMSIGVSSYPSAAKSKHQLINTADDALYRAKSFNKNRVEIYHNILDETCTHMNIAEDTIKSLKKFISMINVKDRYTYGHTERVVIYSKWFSEYLDLNDEDKLNLRIAAYLHDIGKVEIPESVLNKKDKLADEEFEILKSHPTMGADLINNIEEFKPLIPLIKHHHERYDGRGYPSKLKGDEIPY
ncbi:diguanylate cyclase, partial [Romboutsia weinsteinii]